MKTLLKTVPYDLNPAWEDLRFPAQGINPPGAASDPTREAATGALLFSHTQDNIIAGIAQMPHSWREPQLYLPALIGPHFHWERTTNDPGDIAFVLEWKWYNVGDVAPAAYTSAGIATVRVGGDDVADQHSLSAWSKIDGYGKRISSIFVWRMLRDVSEDSYPAPVRFWEFDIHYEKDSIGSTGGEFTK